MESDLERLRGILSNTDIEEIEEKIRAGYYESNARRVAEEVVQYKREHPENLPDLKPVSNSRRRIVLFVTISVVSSLYFGARAFLRREKN